MPLEGIAALGSDNSLLLAVLLFTILQSYLSNLICRLEKSICIVSSINCSHPIAAVQKNTCTAKGSKSIRTVSVVTIMTSISNCLSIYNVIITRKLYYILYPLPKNT